MEPDTYYTTYQKKIMNAASLPFLKKVKSATRLFIHLPTTAPNRHSLELIFSFISSLGKKIHF